MPYRARSPAPGTGDTPKCRSSVVQVLERERKADGRKRKARHTGGTETRDETTQGAGVPVETPAPHVFDHALRNRTLDTSEARGTKPLEVQVDGSRREIGPLFLVSRRIFLALADDGEAGHDGCDGYETDTQGANKRLPRRGVGRRFPVAPQYVKGRFRAERMFEKVTNLRPVS
jgi:hypothetical protein